MKTWSEFSNKFIEEHGDIYERCLMTCVAKMEFEVHSGMSKQEVLNKMIEIIQSDSSSISLSYDFPREFCPE